MEPTILEVNIHMAYMDQQYLNSANHATVYAMKQKSIFDKNVLQSHAGEVIFKPGKLVQVYANTTDMTMASSRKLIPKWSAHRRVVSQINNSYTLTSLEGFPINSLFYA
ncbi:hypothetical protein BDR06DRAFT_878264 [Suillus hirtellus]|nr:hypothetical protein BDR06DRAFT_878264 [Suillus hirtellus]